ncbi:MAG: Ig-like domain-containing protein [Bacteroidales bacterium]|nr:Ig-like domain-containing protein [Bacteroidales bacterium]
MTKTYLGYGYTNENGVATLDFDAEDNPLPKKSYQCHSRTASVVAEASVNNIVTSSENIRFCEGYVPPTESLTLTADKNILSYADNDTVTLTATYDGTTLEGKSVVFKIGDTVLATETTDSNGVATYEYESQGVGDVTFTVECMNLQETYELQDCIYYHDMTSADSSHWTIPSNANASYSSNGMQFSGSGWSDAYLEVPLTKPYSVEFDLTQWSSNPSYLEYFWDSTKTTRYMHMMYMSPKTIFDTYPNQDNSWNGSISQGSHIKIEVNEDNAKLYVNDELKLTKSYSMPSSSLLGLGKSSNSPTTWKNIKIKPL